MSGEFACAPTLTRADDGNHAPGAQPKWQESSLVAFVHVSDDHLGLTGVRAPVTDRRGRSVEMHGLAADNEWLQWSGQQP